LARWGFAPFWADAAASKRPPPINARAESIGSSPMFRDAQRCLVPATGFYEWQPYPAGEMEAYPVAPLVNSFQNEGAELIAPVQAPPAQLSLF
jgi:putative SOS response-associated peptidase YedK